MLVGLLGLPATPGCAVDYALKAVDSLPRAASEAARRRSVSAWAGQYVFSECAPVGSPPACWTYDVVLGEGGMASVKADGPQLAIHAMARPTVDDGFLLLPFEYYLDGAPDRPFFHLPFHKEEGFGSGELLARMGQDRAGRICLVFAAIRSPLHTRAVCAQ
jgi:hypothetical protein